MIRNKASLVAQGYSQMEGVDYDETFSPIVRIESIRILLALVCHLKFKFKFKREDVELIVAQVYVDDIIFGSTKDKLAHSFLKLRQGEFEMSMIRELTHFLGLQIRQQDSGIFLSQSKYARNLVKNFGLESASSIRTPMSPNVKLTIDLLSKSVDLSLYRSMIGSLLYLTTSRLDISYSVEVCAKYQANPKESHMIALKRIIKYVKTTADFGVWYSKDKNDVLAGYSDANWAGNADDRKSTLGIVSMWVIILSPK